MVLTVLRKEILVSFVPEKSEVDGSHVTTGVVPLLLGRRKTQSSHQLRKLMENDGFRLWYYSSPLCLCFQGLQRLGTLVLHSTTTCSPRNMIPNPIEYHQSQWAVLQKTMNLKEIELTPTVVESHAV